MDEQPLIAILLTPKAKNALFFNDALIFDPLSIRREPAPTCTGRRDNSRSFPFAMQKKGEQTVSNARSVL